MIGNHHVGLLFRYGFFDLLRLIHYFHPAVEMKPQEAAVHNACEAIGSHNHQHIILAGENGRMAEPPADLADECAGSGEIRQPGRANLTIGATMMSPSLKLTSSSPRSTSASETTQARASSMRLPDTRVPRITSPLARAETVPPAETASRSQTVIAEGRESVSYRRAACSRLRDAVARNASTSGSLRLATSSSVRWNTSPSRRRLRSSASSTDAARQAPAASDAWRLP